jgi:hypothetical protein
MQSKINDLKIKINDPKYLAKATNCLGKIIVDYAFDKPDVIIKLNKKSSHK